MTINLSSNQYPEPSVVEERLKQLAADAGDASLKPFRVDVVAVHGGKPPLYCVVIRSAQKAALRQKLEPLLHRTLTCGMSSFMLKAHEAARILKA